MMRKSKVNSIFIYIIIYINIALFLRYGNMLLENCNTATTATAIQEKVSFPVGG
jgi:hypothetical protein